MMKRVLVLVLALLMVGALASAEVDLSGMTFDELVALRNQVDQAIWASDGWQEVTVPAGNYTIGKDIPAGRWTLTCDGTGSMVNLYNTFDGISDIDELVAMAMVSKDNPYNIDLVDGQGICITIEAVTFTPYTSAALGFK